MLADFYKEGRDYRKTCYWRRNTGLFDKIGQQRIFATEDHALAAIYEWLGEEGKDDLLCKVSAPPPEPGRPHL